MTMCAFACKRCILVSRPYMESLSMDFCAIARELHCWSLRCALSMKMKLFENRSCLPNCAFYSRGLMLVTAFESKQQQQQQQYFLCNNLMPFYIKIICDIPNYTHVYYCNFSPRSIKFAKFSHSFCKSTTEEMLRRHQQCVCVWHCSRFIKVVSEIGHTKVLAPNKTQNTNEITINK